MALFSRRCLQRMLNENARFLAPDQAQEHVRRLNNFRDDYLSTEWEVALLHAFSKVGKVQHEPKLGGKRFVDLLFTTADSRFEFAADIATVSDQQLHKRNPVTPLWDELTRRVRKQRITSGGFQIEVGAPLQSISRGRGVRHQLLLPRIRDFPHVIFNAKFDSFLVAVRRDPATQRDYRVRDAAIDVLFRYVPQARGTSTGSYLSYTCANVVDDNPVFNALKDKSRQLKASKYQGPMGVFICDGGCRMLHSRQSNWAEYTLEEVVREFFRQHRSVGFVVTIGVQHDYSHSVGRGHHHPEIGIAVNPLFSGIEAPLRSAIGRMEGLLPIVEASPENALTWARPPRSWPVHYGGWQMIGGRQIKLSAITVLQLLAGELDYATFAKAHGFDRPTANPFARALDQGRIIDRCSIEKCPDEDDDWIAFDLGEPDPAIARFTDKPA